MRETECPNCGHFFQPGLDPEWAERMRRLRVSKRVTLAALAGYLGYSAVYISDIERGKRNKPAPRIVSAWQSFLENQP
jgi:transcriptional regulator with XRE-family HTH domain